MAENEKLEGTTENNGAGINKVFQLAIMFDRKEGSPFGGLNSQSVTVVVSEEVRNRVMDQYYNREGILSVQLGSGTVRHINVANILYIDETEIVNVKENSNGK